MKRLPILPALACALLLQGPVAPAASPADCLSGTPLAMQVRIGAAPPQQALLVGGTSPALRIIDARTSDTLWSADAGTAAAQRFPAMTAAFSGSFTALDTDRDGLHDRLYAGDLAGRLWRFDLHNGAPAAAFASGGVFASFGNSVGRGFRAPPDVSLATAPGASPWFNIAIGTASPGRGDANNRFYVLRDHAPFQPWSNAQYADWQPPGEADLLRVTTTMAPPPAGIDAGWFIELGSGDVLTASLTVAGRTVFAITDAATALDGCRAAVSIATADLVQVQLLATAAGDWRTALAGTHAIDTGFTFSTDAAGGDATTALCRFGDSHVSGCDVSLHARRSWWRREDAE